MALEGVNGIVVFWQVTKRMPGQWNLGCGAAHNLSERTNNALARTFNVNQLTNKGGGWLARGINNGRASARNILCISNIGRLPKSELQAQTLAVCGRDTPKGEQV